MPTAARVEDPDKDGPHRTHMRVQLLQVCAILCVVSGWSCSSGPWELALVPRLLPDLHSSVHPGILWVLTIVDAAGSASVARASPAMRTLRFSVGRSRHLCHQHFRLSA